MEWEPIETAIKDGRFYDTYNAYNGERRISRFVSSPPQDNWGFNIWPPEGHWEGWGYDWGNEPTHCKPMPVFQPPTKEISDE